MNRIALLRKERKLNQKEFGTIIGVAQNTICNWENENREPDHESLKKWRTFLIAQLTIFWVILIRKRPPPWTGVGQEHMDTNCWTKFRWRKYPKLCNFWNL